MARLIWSPQAAGDLTSICEFIAHDSAEYAAEFATRVMASVEILREFPGAGRVVPEFEEQAVRELVLGSYRIIYEAGPDTVSILTIHHSARRLRHRPKP